MKRYKTLPTIPELKKFLHYDPETGIFTWKQHVYRNQCKLGAVAGNVNASTKYVMIGFKGKSYLAHRLAWLYMTGVAPNSDIDHVDRNRSNNVWKNLRRASSLQNNINSSRKRNRSGFRGVTYFKGIKKWCARIGGVYLGVYSTPEEAARAYDEAALRSYGEFAILNLP